MMFHRFFSVRNKILFLFSSGILLLVTVMILCFQYSHKNYLDNLYQQTSDSIFLISNDLKQNLDSFDTASKYLVTDSSLQEYLSKLKEIKFGYPLNALRDRIDDLIFSYSVTEDYVSSITLVTDRFTLCRGRNSVMEEEAYLKELVERAKKKRGACLFCTSEKDPTTILLVRSCLQIKNLSLSYLGTVLYRIDLERLVQKLMKPYEYIISEVPFVIMETETRSLLYPYDKIEEDEWDVILGLKKNSYQIETIFDRQYFVVNHTIEKPDWQYNLLIPYETVFGQIRNVFFLSLAVMFTVLIYVFFFVWIMTTKMFSHFGFLLEKMKRVSEGNLTPMENATDYENQKDEIGYLHQNFDRMLQEINRLIKENYEKQILLREAQIHSLEEQINPHFLNNTLDMIYWYAWAKNQTEICTITEAMAKLMHASLVHTSQTQALKEELVLCHYFLNIEQLRFDERLKYTEICPDSILNLEVPFMCIQPLLENAVKYGVEQSIDACEICLKIYADERLHIEVSNEGSEIPEDLLEKIQDGRMRSTGHGIGLLNIDKRAKLLYGEAYGLSFRNTEDCAFVILTLPIRFANGTKERMMDFLLDSAEADTKREKKKEESHK